MTSDTIKLRRLFLKVNPKLLATILFQNSTKGLCRSLTFLFNRIWDSAGTRVSVNNSAPNREKPRVKASGENILPSTFWKENIGINEVMIINLEKKMAFPNPVPVCLIHPALAILLNFSIPSLWAL
ncbi:hypothetical protein D3C80_912780 [compost metagenome]